MVEYIEREAAIKRFNFAVLDCLGMEPTIRAGDIIKALKSIPAADVVPMDFHERCLQIEIQKRMALEKADVRPVVKAKWEENKRGSYCVVCSNCGFGFPTGFVWHDCNRAADEREFSIMTEDADLNFCPNCGADMRPEPPKEET